MTPTQLIESELDHIAKRRQRYLAQGKWQAAAYCDIEQETLLLLKKRIEEEAIKQHEAAFNAGKVE